MRRALLLFLTLAECNNGTAREPVIATSAPAAKAAPSAVAAAAPCALSVGAPHRLALPAELAALGPQFFHPGVRDGFNDLIQGTRRYRWYDPSDLEVGVEPPGDMTMIWQSTEHFFVGYGEDALRVARRRGAVAPPVGSPPFKRLLDVTEDSAGNAWLLTQDASPPAGKGSLFVWRVAPALSVVEYPAVPDPGSDWRDRRIEATVDGRVAVVWLSQDARGLSIQAAWSIPKGPWTTPKTLDRVDLAPDAAELSVRTSVGLALARHGQDAIAVAWRPLAPRPGERVDKGTVERPPRTPVPAEIRIVVAHEDGVVEHPTMYPTVARALMFTSGVGPWSLSPTGLTGASVRGHAVFVWNETSDKSPKILLVEPEASEPRAVAAGSFRTVPRTAPNGALELLLLRSAGEQQAVDIDCRPR